MILTKECTKCYRELSIDNFRLQASTKDGRAYHCRQCADNAAKERYSKKKQEIIQKNLEYQSQNLDNHNESNKKYSKSPLGKINRNLNRRLTKLLGKNRESFFHLIGTSASALVVHLAATLPHGMKIDDYGSKWKIQFIVMPSSEELQNAELHRKIFNWTNLIAKEKKLGESYDLNVK